MSTVRHISMRYVLHEYHLRLSRTSRQSDFRAKTAFPMSEYSINLSGGSYTLPDWLCAAHGASGS